MRKSTEMQVRGYTYATTPNNVIFGDEHFSVPMPNVVGVTLDVETTKWPDGTVTGTATDSKGKLWAKWSNGWLVRKLVLNTGKNPRRVYAWRKSE